MSENNYCCKEFEKSIDNFIDKNDDGTYDITCTSNINFHNFDKCWLRIKYCPFCGEKLPCKNGEHDYIPVLDKRKSVCKVCGKCFYERDLIKEPTEEFKKAMNKAIEKADREKVSTLDVGLCSYENCPYKQENSEHIIVVSKK